MSTLSTSSGAVVVARREIRDQLRDWRILGPVIILTLFFPLLMNFTARTAIGFVEDYGAEIIGERLLPFLLMVVGFFPISVSLVIALESFAGERERMSLEPLLATPLTDAQLYFGKIVASLFVPLAAAYLGIGVYLAGLVVRVGWEPTPQLLAQVLLLTAAQAIVMVTGSVVVSSQTTSVRAANLLASFIIIPVAQLIIAESLVMFWGNYGVLWWIVLALILVAAVLARMGLHTFNREELLGREFDGLDPRWMAGQFVSAFRGTATSLASWYRELLTVTLPGIRGSIVIMILALSAAYLIGFRWADRYTLPTELFGQVVLGDTFLSDIAGMGFLSPEGFMWVVGNNLRALAIATVLGAFTLGILAVALLMAPIGIVGYIAGNLSLAGADPTGMMAALVIPHGVLEVPAAVIAGASILQLGLAALSLPRGSSLGESWLAAAGVWARVNLGLVLPLILMAAAIEVYVTPRIAALMLSGVP